jgi:hypothetical protein
MLHLKKLSVGSTDIDGLQKWQEELLATRKQIIHVTRSFPRRADEILLGGSMYWVIKGKMCARQLIEKFVEIERQEGGVSCGIVLKRGLIPVLEKRHRPFQGWRYLEQADVPPDLPFGDSQEDRMPAEMAEELRDLGLL